MRRPVKPFVTEYKGPNRRPNSPAAAGTRSAGGEFSYATAANEVFARPAADSTPRFVEDSYEAAMRAADALFAPVEKPAPRVAPHPVVQTDPLADQPDFEPASADLSVHESGGRILRVIDEPPAIDLVELEAERAPKRRGRKPGSKNKPKADDGAQVSFAMPAAAMPQYAQPIARKPIATSTGDDSNESTPRVAKRSAVSDYRSRDDKRFGWVRTKLLPGQEWKRRLPKVCW